MSDESLEVIKARLLAQAAAMFDRDIAEINHLAAKHGLVATLSVAGKEPAPPKQSISDPPGLTIRNLVERYLSDQRSPYQELRSSTRKVYDRLLRRLRNECGNEKVADLKSQKIQNLYDGWAAGSKVAMSHSLVTMLRGLANFGMNVLQDAECERLSLVLHSMYFPTAKPREELLTSAQAEAIREKAHQRGLHSLALAQAFQFDCMLGQRDVIGEWVPISDSVPSDIISESQKWVRGLRWNEIDDNLVLRHPPSAGGEIIEVRLSEHPMVMAELRRFGQRPKSGPVVVYERSELPYLDHQFRRAWREIADAVGVPKTVRNRDSRPNAKPPERRVRKARGER